MTSEKNCIEKINFLRLMPGILIKKVNFIIDNNKYIMNKKDGSITKERY
jgi:hypothetical protein